MPENKKVNYIVCANLLITIVIWGVSFITTKIASGVGQC